MKKTVLIIGANSDIAKEISNVFLKKIFSSFNDTQ